MIRPSHAQVFPAEHAVEARHLSLRVFNNHSKRVVKGDSADLSIELIKRISLSILYRIRWLEIISMQCIDKLLKVFNCGSIFAKPASVRRPIAGVEILDNILSPWREPWQQRLKC